MYQLLPGSVTFHTFHYPRIGLIVF